MPTNLEDISDGRETLRISFVNTVNENIIPPYISYVPHCIIKSPTLLGDFNSVPIPCDCENSCNGTCSCSFNTLYTDGKLSKNYDNSTSKPIIECTALCSCDSSCSNRIVQYGIKYSLQVYMTELKGFGVRTLDFIPTGVFVCEYAGELINAEEAKKRFCSMSDEESSYIYVLNEYSSECCIQTIIDPTYVGNVGRFLNHSCTPNLISVPVRFNSMIPKICFFATEDILPMQELTYSYETDYVPIAGNQFPAIKSSEKSARKCLCVSVKCKGILPFKHESWKS